MTLEEKLKKSEQDLKKVKQRMEKIQREIQRLKELKAKKEKEEKEQRQKALGELIERELGRVDLKDPKFLEFLDCVKEDFVKNESFPGSVSGEIAVQKDGPEQKEQPSEGWKTEPSTDGQF